MRLFLLLFVLVAFASGVHAQASFGVKAGLNTSTILFDDEGGLDEPGLDKQPRLGFVGGLTADLPFTPTFGLRAEVLYAQKGYALDFDFEGEIGGETFSVDGKQTLQLDYIEIPLMLRYSIPMENGLEVGLLGGLVPAFKINEGIGCSGFESEVDGEDVCEDIEQELEDDDLGLKSFDVGGAIGATVGAGPFGVDLRYTYGFIDLSEEDADNFANDNPAHNSVFSITAAYRFGR